MDALVEGASDEIVARRLVTHTGHTFGTCFGKKGCRFLQSKITGFAKRVEYGGNSTLVLVDYMDFNYVCPAALVAEWVPNRPRQMLLRVVVRELESWLLADRNGLSRHLGISAALVPDNPDNDVDPKRSLINLARRSRRTWIRNAYVPKVGVSSSVGPGYLTQIEQYVLKDWDPERARIRSPSLNNCLLRLTDLA
ncbi:MAG: hypothetical protein ACYDCJ_08930 [Gammaproteobacteria bacterium]